jgi:hypothetical protein
MGGGKETPRQKMIGMMYLVLTALLALNVSKQILDAFVAIEDNIQRGTVTQLEKGNGNRDELKTEMSQATKDEAGQAKKAKIIAKEEEKKAKDDVKQKEKEKKQKAKEEKKKKQIVENVILGSSFITDSSGNEVIIGCVEILKSGLSKGKHCGCKIVSENMCKRHFNLANKVIVNDK